MWYNYHTYAELGAIYLCEMKKLPHDIKEEYQMGNFVVKMSKQKFNQMDTYQSQEWLIIGQKGEGIVSNTKTTTALLAFPYNLRSHMSNEINRPLGWTKMTRTLTTWV